MIPHSTLLLLLLPVVLQLVGQTQAQDKDPCLETFQAGPCRGVKHVFTFDASSGTCKPAVYGGCKGNGNRFEGIVECEKVCSKHLKEKFSAKNSVCELPPLTEDRACRGLFPRYTFNAAEGRCERYNYGGCKGSLNLYHTVEECINTCIAPTDSKPALWSKAGTGSNSDIIIFPTDDQAAGRSADDDDSSEEADEDYEEEEDVVDVCSLPPVWPGPMGCLGFIKKWTFSKRDGGCIEYVYGGCRGTPNLFNTQAECQEACAESSIKTAEVCQLPIKPGPCRGKKNAFAFNTETGRCEGFVYGGCQGNENIFKTAIECVNTC